VLHAAVHEAVRADEFEFHVQDEVGERTLGFQEIVVRNFVFAIAGDERAVFDAPQLVRLAEPAFESFSIHERHRRGERRSD
jgi:hypothetical protein